jgi:hypothetical protein
MSLEGKSVEEIQALAELASSLASDPKTRMGFLQLTKAVNPTTSIPEIDIPASLRKQFEEPLKKLDALEKRQAEQDMERKIEAARRKLMRDKNVTEDEMPAIEKLMVEKGIANHETAIDHLRMSQRAAEPTAASAAQGIRRFEKPTIDLKAFNGDQKAWSYANAYAAIDELRGRKAVA